jgi:hypothetical protein
LFLSLQHLPAIGGGKFGCIGVSKAAIRPILPSVSRLRKEKQGEILPIPDLQLGLSTILFENLFRFK